MKTFNVPSRDQVSNNNQQLFHVLQKSIGKVPNLFATLAKSENALSTYLTLQNSKTSLRAKEKEVVNLVVSQVNDCVYCLSAHTVFAKMHGFTDAQILEIRAAEISFDTKLNALASLTESITTNRGKADEAALDAFFEVGYTEENLVDLIVLIGDKTITNYLHKTTQVPIDWPAVPALNTQLA